MNIRPVRLILAFAVALAATLSLTAAPAAAIPAGYTVNGIDVYSGNGTIDWSAASGSGVRFGWAKATEGLHRIDPAYQANRSNARSAGVYLGAYAFGRPDQGDPVGQADLLVDNSGYSNDGTALPPQLDIEWPYTSNGSYVAPYPCYGLSTSQMVSWIRTFVDRVKARTGRDAAIYTNYYWWTECTGNNASFGANPLEIAHYVAVDSSSSYGPIPAGWSGPTAWQYNCDHTVPGAPSANHVCQTAFIGGLNDLLAFAGGAKAGSLNGDGRAEIVKKRTDGVLTAFYNGGLTASKGISWDQLATDGYPIGNGWAGDANSAVYFADLNGDGRKDMIKKRTDGVLTAFYNGGLTASKGISWDQLATDGYPIGSGWGGDANSAVYFADLNGDGRADIVKKRTDGVLTAFYNGGLTASKGISWDQLATDGYPIGNGWGGDANSAVYFADLNGDGRADIVKKRTDGVLTAFYNGGLTASKGISWDQLATDGYPIGNGWAGDANSAVYFADLNGDGRADIVKKRTDGVLTAFYNGGLTASKGISWDQLATDGYPIGNGWGGDADSAVYFS
ncbi:hypothetical protein J5X84_15010 [Streptosporangiaceae bacterium NEAU-GS5]|nr:hypothetical protein [Streptosporangiaceae bacterium NEAU-GS5]